MPILTSLLMSMWMQVIISSAFESSTGLGQYVHLAAALGANASNLDAAADADVTAHGLGTASWFKEDLAREPLLGAPSVQGRVSL